ncbi:MAG: T9SS type A sorting domain-containing protein [Cytophagales bacterium]|nr:T9SS type A sorting domain-containing protein [Cytophagales bacterium]
MYKTYKTVLGVGIMLGALYTLSSNISRSSGPHKAQSISAVGPNKSHQSCSVCHSGGNYSPSMTISLKKDGNAVTTYEPGETYQLEFNIAATGSPAAYGMQAVAIVDKDDSNAGVLTADITPNTHISGDTYFEQSQRNTNSKFEASWRAPAAGTGSVSFIGIGLAVNGSGTSGDEATSEVTLSIQENISTSTLEGTNTTVSVYPNPTNKTLNVVLSNPSNISLVDQLGNVNINIEGSTGEQTINVEDLAPGVYNLIISNDAEVIKERVVIQ